MTQSLAGETFAPPETKKPSLGLGSPTDSTTLRLPSENVGFRSARARSHPGGHPGCACGVRLKVGIHGPVMVARVRRPRKPVRGAEAAAHGERVTSPTQGVTETRTRMRLPGSSPSRERYLVPL